MFVLTPDPKQKRTVPTVSTLKCHNVIPVCNACFPWSAMKSTNEVAHAKNSWVVSCAINEIKNRVDFSWGSTTKFNELEFVINKRQVFSVLATNS